AVMNCGSDPWSHALDRRIPLARPVVGATLTPSAAIVQNMGCNCHLCWAYRRASRLCQGRPDLECGRSSGVEHNLAKVRVVSSNLIARSKNRKAGKAGD